MMRSIAALLFLAAVATAYVNNEYVRLPGHTKPNSYSLPLPSEYILDSQLPKAWDWDNVNGTSYVTKSLNQHIPQYCGSCWAHGAVSSLADRIKIARKAQGRDIDLSVQFILNCGAGIAGSCHGGSHSGAFEFIKEKGYIPYDTCLQYQACSNNSIEGICKGGDWSCSAENICRTCSTFAASGGKCVGVDQFPNATIAEYGELKGEKQIMKEVFARGPVACGVDAGPLDNYTGGILDFKGETSTNHVVSIVGWGEHKGVKYWNVRNSWGEYWGEMGFFRVVRGENQLQLENGCGWATPGSWTEKNFPCSEDGHNCQKSVEYVDPSIIPMWHME